MFEKYPYTNLHELNLDWIIGKVKEIEEGYDGIVSRMGAVELAMDNLEGDVATLQSSYRALSASVNAHSLAIENLGNSVTALRTDVNTLLGDVNTLTATSASHTTQIADLSTRMTGAEGSITTLTSTANTHTSQIAALAARVNTIETTITSYGNRISSLETAVNILNMRTAANEADIATLEEILYTSGENVINLSSLPQTVNGITFALDTDGKTILAQGTALSTGTGDASIALASPITTAGKYKITCAMTGNVGTSMRYVSTTNTSRTIIGSAIYVDDMQPSAGDLTYLTVSYGTAGVQVDCSFKPEIMELTAPESVPAIVITDETYAGYNPIIVTNAIGGEITALTSEVNATQDLHGYDRPWAGGEGKNLYVGSPSFEGYTNISSWTLQDEKYNGHDVYKKSSALGGTANHFSVEEGTYTFSVMVKTGSNTNAFIYTIDNADAGKATVDVTSLQVSTNTSWTKALCTFTVISAGLIAPRIELNSDNDIYISEYQLEKGSTATDYEPYENICPISGRMSCVIETEGDIYTTTFPSPCYGGKLDVKNGLLTTNMHRRFFYGYPEELWQSGASVGTHYRMVHNMGDVASTGQVNAISNEMEYVNDYSQDSTHYYIYNGKLYVFLPVANETEFRAWLASNPLQIVYPIATPTTDTVDPQVIELARGYNEITSETGNMDATIQTFIGVPKPPTTDGTYVLTATVTDGMYALSWESTT